MRVRIRVAGPYDASAIFRIGERAAEHLTAEHGRGHWSAPPTEGAVARGIASSHVLVAEAKGEVLGTLRLVTRKPWAIDISYFAPCVRPLYLVDMAVDPGFQLRGVGRRLLDAAREAASTWPADAIRLDAYAAAAGAGAFYARCGFREVGRATYRGVGLVYYEWRVPVLSGERGPGPGRR